MRRSIAAISSVPRSEVRSISLLAAVVMLLTSTETRAQWSNDGVPVSIAWGTQQFADVVSDGAGGAIFSWLDTRNGPTRDIYAQRLDQSGLAVWLAADVAICSAAGEQYSHRSVSDGNGGALVVWDDNRSGTAFHVYVQKVDGAGNIAWAANGTPVFTGASAYATSPDIASDGLGGAIVTWHDYRSGLKVYVQHIDSAGNALWLSNGIALSGTGQALSRIISDGTGGAIVAWGYGDIYAQRIDAAGNFLWSLGGLPVCTASGVQREPQLVSDGAGGAVIVWTDFRDGLSDIYAQRVGPDGTLLWQVNGARVCTASDEQSWPELVGDGAGGAVFTWRDARALPGFDIYAQRLDTSGLALWADNGIAVCTAPGDRYQPQVVAAGQGRTVILWQDHRENAVVYAQQLSGAGLPFWETDGIAPSSYEGSQTEPTAVTDGQGGVLIGWSDYRSGTARIYAQRIVVDNPVPTLITSFAARALGTAVEVQWDVWSDEYLERFILYRRADATPLPVVIASGRFDSDVRSYIDESVAPGATYHYELVIQTRVGEETRSMIATVTVPAMTALLGQNYPNPFNPSTTIEYTLTERAAAAVGIYDATGTLVVRLDQGIREAGTYRATWHGLDANGHPVGSGVYFYGLEGTRTVASRKMLLLK